jgi:prolyl oligopeptidase
MVANRFVTQWMTDAHEVLKVYSTNGAFEKSIDLPTIGSVAGFTGRRKDQEGFYGFSSFTYPGRRLSIRFRERQELGLPSAEGGLLLRRVRDGAGLLPVEGRHEDSDVPDVSEGPEEGRLNPTYLYGYGGFNISLTPAFSPALVAWMEMGGSSRSPTCAAAASTARTGTTPDG